MVRETVKKLEREITSGEMRDGSSLYSIGSSGIKIVSICTTA